MAWTTSTDPRRSYVSLETAGAEIAGWLARAGWPLRQTVRCRNPALALCGGSAALAGLIFSAIQSSHDALVITALSLLLAYTTGILAFGQHKCGASRVPPQSKGVSTATRTHHPDPGSTHKNPSFLNDAELTSVARLTSRMSHDLRTPLNAVIGFSDLMRSEIHGPVGNERYREYIEHIGTSGEQLLKVTEDTLTMTQLIARPSLPVQTFTAADVILDTPWLDLDLEAAAALAEDIRLTGDRDTLELAIDRLCQALAERASLDTRYRLDLTDDCGVAVLTFAPVDAKNHEQRASAEQPGPAHRAYPAVHDDLQVCVLATMFELLGATLTWHHQHGAPPSASIAIEITAQHDLPFADTSDCVSQDQSSRR